jgi:hypothetical protein
LACQRQGNVTIPQAANVGGDQWQGYQLNLDN